MTEQIDLEPGEYRETGITAPRLYPILFLISVVTCIALTYSAPIFGQGWVHFLLFVAAFTAGVSYARWTGKNGFLQPGGMTTILVWVLVAVVLVVVGSFWHIIVYDYLSPAIGAVTCQLTSWCG